MQAPQRHLKHQPAPATDSWRWSSVTAGLLLLGIALAWANSLNAPFLLDDHSSILTNLSIRSSSPLDWLQPPATAGETVSGRPLLNLSFAINHALFGFDVRAYRITNLAIHAFAALTLAGVVRRTLGRFWLVAQNSAAPGVAAAAAALLWSLHPLTTAAVTYVVQRAESLAGLFCLLTLYCFLRSLESTGRSGRWRVLSAVLCLLGMATKETAVITPVVVLLYDRAFVAGSFRSTWKLRRHYYLLLAATWLLLAALVLTNQGRGGSAGAGSTITPWDYLLTQCSAIVHYLRLAIWPAGQVFDYGTPVVASAASVIPQVLFLSTAIGATGWLLVRNHGMGFLGACFFLALAPSSSVVPVSTQTIAEHRMYLALIPVVLLLVLLLRQLIRAQALWLAATGVTVLSLGAATFARNATYSSELELWQDTATKAPTNPRAHNNLGLALANVGRPDQAIRAYLKAIELQPNHAFAHSNLGNVYLAQRRWAEACREYEAAVASDPAGLDARVNLGHVLSKLGRLQEAKAQFQAVLNADPSAHDARTNLAAVLIANGEIAAAITHLQTVLQAVPALAEARLQLGLALERSGDLPGARAAMREAIAAKPDLAEAHLALGNLALAEGDPTTARDAYEAVLRLDSRSAEAQYGLGNLFAQAGEYSEAMTRYQKALQHDPANLQARTNLGNCQLALGQVAAAIATYNEVLKFAPNDQATRQNLELATELLRTQAR